MTRRATDGTVDDHGPSFVFLLAMLFAAASIASTAPAFARPALAGASGPTFARDVAPILFRHCAGCHHPGSNQPFSLIAYEDVRPRAKAIAAATRSRYMPPWKPEAGYGEEMLGRRGLSEQEIETIQQWAAAGAPQGDAADLLRPPDWNDGWRLGVPDVVIRMPEPYAVPPAGPDVFRIFVVPIPTEAVRFVKAIEFLPGTRAVHHANMRLDETQTSRNLDLKDPAPGYDGLLARTALFPDGHFFGWTPGQLAQPSDDLAWRLNPGTDMVLQLHLRPTGAAESVQASIGLYFAKAPPRLTPVMLRLGKQNIDIPAGVREYVTTDSYVLPVDVDVHGVQPHAHYRARQIEGFATLPDGTRKWLILIRDWDFDWQDTYRYLKPVPLPKGTTLTMRYTYDNSQGNRRNPQLPPQRVHWGQNSSDEMGDLWVQVVPHTQPDADQLLREFRQKVFREDILGYETVLQRTPDDVSLHDDVALLHLAVGHTNEAVGHFRQSVRLAPGTAATHFNLGTALAAAGQYDAAIGEYEKALALDGNYAHAHNNLGSLLMATGRVADAASHFSRAIGIDPGYAEAHNNLGKLFGDEGRLDDAVEQLSKALAIRDTYADAHYNLAGVLVRQNRLKEAVAHYRAALTLSPASPQVLMDLAWMLSTSPSAEIRDSRGASLLAERAVALTGRRSPRALDVAAAAYAAAGRFEDAVLSAQAAMDLLREQSAERSTAVASRLRQYQQRTAYTDSPAIGPVPDR